MRSCAEVYQVRLHVSYLYHILKGCTVAHKIYGIPQTINSANYVYFLAYQELFALRSGIGVDGPSDDPKRLIPFKELDRIVTGELIQLDLVRELRSSLITSRASIIAQRARSGVAMARFSAMSDTRGVCVDGEQQYVRRVVLA